METQSFFVQLERSFSDLLGGGEDIHAGYEAINIHAHSETLSNELVKEKACAGTWSVDDLCGLAKLAAHMARFAASLRSHVLEFNGLRFASIWDAAGQWIFGPCEHTRLSDVRALAVRAAAAADLLHPGASVDEAFVAWLSFLKSESAYYRNDEIAGIIAASVSMCRELATTAYRTARLESPVVIASSPKSEDAPALDMEAGTLRRSHFTVEEAAKFLHVNQATIRREINRGNLKAKKVGRIIRIHGKALAAYQHDRPSHK